MKQTHSIPAAAALLATGILLSRVLGYFREMLLAYEFGASGTTDAFYAAFQIPDLLNYFLAGGALSIAFIPLYNKVFAKEGEGAANDMMAVVIGTIGVIVIAATAVLSWQAEALTRFQFPHFDAATTALTVYLTRIVLPAQIFFITGGVAQAVLLARKNFMAAALAPLIYNICIIAGGFFLHSCCGIAGFAIGTLIGSIAGPFLMPLLFMRGHIPLRVRFAPFNKNFLIYLALAAPLMFGQTLLTLDEWYGRWFGALLQAGTVAHLSYARKLMQVPIAVIGQAVAAAALPTLSKLWSENRVEDLNRTLQTTLQAGLSLAVLAGAGIFVLARPIVALIYQHGVFSVADTDVVTALTATFAFAVPGWIVQQISVRAFYARGDTWRPMALGTALSVAVIPLYFYFSGIMQAEGLALAGAVGMTLNALATLAFARYLHGAPKIEPLFQSCARSAVVAIPAALAAWGVLKLVNGSTFLNLCLGGVAFGIIALPGIFLFGDEGVRVYILRLLRKARG